MRSIKIKPQPEAIKVKVGSLEIISPDGTTMNCRVLIDGKEVRNVKEVRLKVHADDKVARCTITQLLYKDGK